MGRLTRLLDSALDRSVVLSFDRTGFERHAKAFVPADLDVVARLAAAAAADNPDPDEA